MKIIKTNKYYCLTNIWFVLNYHFRLNSCNLILVIQTSLTPTDSNWQNVPVNSNKWIISLHFHGKNWKNPKKKSSFRAKQNRNKNTKIVKWDVKWTLFLSSSLSLSHVQQRKIITEHTLALTNWIRNIFIIFYVVAYDFPLDSFEFLNNFFSYSPLTVNLQTFASVATNRLREIEWYESLYTQLCCVNRFINNFDDNETEKLYWARE